MKTTAKNLLRLLGASLLLVILAYFGGLFEDPGIGPGVAAAPPGLPAPIHRERALRVQRPAWYTAVGTVESDRRVDVSAQVTGLVSALHAEVGTRVEGGAPLAELDRRESQARLLQAQSALAAARASAVEARAGFERVQRLNERAAATPQELEAAEAARARAEAALAAAEEGVTAAQVDRDHGRILSPVAGVVAERPVEVGDLAAPGKRLFTLHDPERLRVEAHVREGLIQRLRVGAELPVLLRDGQLELRAVVEEIVPAADPRSRTVLVRAGLPTAEGLYPGMFARLRVPLVEREVVLVPEEAVVSVGQLDTLLVLQDGRWVRRYVTLGARRLPGDGDLREVLSGLVGGEQIGWND